MKTINLMRFVSILVLWSLSFHAYAQQWYHVELVVFEQLDSYTDEQWPIMDNIASAPLTPNLANKHIQPSRNTSLLNTAAGLNKSAHYQVHYHKSWQQPIRLKNSAKAVKIRSNDQMINGSITLYKATYLHATLDLWLMENKERVDSWSDLTPEGESFDIVRNPNLVESRRIRSKKLYFFDHPKLGALLQLTPINTPEADQASEQPLLPTETISPAN